MAKEDDVLKDAIIGTEKEIFAESFGKEDLTLDETGDRSQEAIGDGLEGQVEPEEEDEEIQPEAEVQPEAPTVEAQAETPPTTPEVQPDPQGRVPAGRLREEAERARAAIAERDALKAQFETAQKAAADREAALLAAFQKVAPQPAKPAEADAPKPPELYEEPVAYAKYVKETVDAALNAHDQRIRDREINASLAQAREKHGQVYEEAWNTLKGLDFKNPDNVALARRMEASPNPGETVVAWHKRNQALREVGDDIGSYKAKIAEETRKTLMADPEFRKELIASLRGDAETGDQGRPRTQVRLPKSLSQTAGNGARGNDLEPSDGSERSTFESAWST